jgi:hypothetical protein
MKNLDGTNVAEKKTSDKTKCETRCISLKFRQNFAKTKLQTDFFRQNFAKIAELNEMEQFKAHFVTVVCFRRPSL